MDAQRTLLAAELSAAQIQNLRLNSTVALVKAIGGGWDPKAAPKR
jgi:outer membrane protein TolC